MPANRTPRSIATPASGDADTAADRSIPKEKKTFPNHRRAALARALPQVQAIAETLPGFKVEAWYGLVGPPGMSPELVKKINADVLSILKHPDFQARLTTDALEPAGGTPEEFAAQIKTDLASWSQLIKSVNIRLE